MGSSLHSIAFIGSSRGFEAGPLAQSHVTSSLPILQLGPTPENAHCALLINTPSWLPSCIALATFVTTYRLPLVT